MSCHFAYPKAWNPQVSVKSFMLVWPMSSELHSFSLSSGKITSEKLRIIYIWNLPFLCPSVAWIIVTYTWCYMFIYPTYSNFFEFSIWFIIFRQFYKCHCHFSGMDSLLGIIPCCWVSHWLRPSLFPRMPDHVNVRYLIRVKFLSYIGLLEDVLP